MTRVRLCLPAAIIAMFLVAFIPTATAASDASEHERLFALFDGYREGSFKLNPLNAMFEGDYRYNHVLGDYISADYLRQSQDLEEQYLKRLGEIGYASLNDEDKLSFDIFKYNREIGLEGFRGGYARMDSLMPLNQFYGLHNFVAQLGGGTSAQPFATAADYDNWLQRAGGFPAWVKQAIANMRQGAKDGVVLPRVIVERVIPQLAAILTDDPRSSVFYKPVLAFPDSVNESDRKRLLVAYEQSARDVIIPAYRELHDFLASEYLSTARASAGLGDLPGGAKWYAYLVRLHTTTGLSPEEIHQIGKEEAARIYAQMEAVKKELGFSGDMQAFFTFMRTDPKFYFTTADALLNSYRDLKPEVEARLSKAFNLMPKADFIVEPIEEFRQVSSATAEYLQPAPDGTRPAIFYVNTYELKSRPSWEREALFVHESVPGHHFQISIAQEQEHLPEFRRFQGPTAFVEGWGLYAETLGYELGLYSDPYQRMGALAFQIWRADRLVVDTGMHALGWTREQAIDFMLSNSPKTRTDIVAEVERYIAIPGQALAYKIGQTRLTALRARAQDKLGKKFDVRAFHDQLLVDGAMPLALLERKVNRWIESMQ